MVCLHIAVLVLRTFDFNVYNDENKVVVDERHHCPIHYSHTGKTQMKKSREYENKSTLLKDLRAERTDETTTTEEKKKIIICLNIQKHLIRFSLFDSYKQFQVLLYSEI